MLIIISESSAQKLFDKYDYQTIDIKNALGDARIKYGSNGLIKTLTRLGYKSLDEVESTWEKKYILRSAEKMPVEIVLVSWHSTAIGNGFGRQVIQTIFDLAKKLKLDQFRIFLPSAHAQRILNHYVEKGVLEPDKTIQSGTSDQPHFTNFYLIKRPE